MPGLRLHGNEPAQLLAGHDGESGVARFHVIRNLANEIYHFSRLPH